MFGSFQSPVIAGVQLLLGVLAMGLAVLSFVQANTNRDLQQTAASNQVRIDRADTFAKLDNGLIQLMAKSAADDNDAALTKLLSDNGVTFRKAPGAPGEGAKP